MRSLIFAGTVIVLLVSGCGAATEIGSTSSTQLVANAEPDTTWSPGVDAGSASRPIEEQGTEPTEQSATTAEIPTTTASTPTTTPGEAPEMQSTTVPGYDDQVTRALDDLAARLGAEAALITVIASEAVTWRDGSIGCPQPGMSYTQALVPGRLIVLEHGGIRYNYHSGRSGEPFYCAIPEPPLESEAPDQ